MKLARTVDPEELDHLRPNDPAAIRSRRDLRRVHRAMGTCSVLAKELNSAMNDGAASVSPLRVLELGAGDGSLMLRVARALTPPWPQVQLTLLDQVDLLDAKTRAAYEATGWNATSETVDVFDWARDQPRQDSADKSVPPAWDLIIANLFLHHFEGETLRALLAAIASSCRVFVACEPRRSAIALAGSHCIGALGVSRVTRADAVTSVHAGFAGNELSALWVSGERWVIHERPAGFFSHCFTAKRTATAEAD